MADRGAEVSFNGDKIEALPTVAVLLVDFRTGSIGFFNWPLILTNESRCLDLLSNQ